MKILLCIAVVSAALAGCSTYVPQRYSLSADTNVALKAGGVQAVGVGSFTGPATFDSFCRGVGPIEPSDGMTPEGYIRKALADELKVAGAFAEQNPRVVLTGQVERLAFSSSRALTGGSWDIALNVASSNGKTASVSEHYEFRSGFDGMTACKQTAEAFMPAVQNLISQLVKSPDFPALVASAAAAVAHAPAPVAIATTPLPVAAPVAAPAALPAPVIAPVIAVAAPPAPATVAALPVLPAARMPAGIKFLYQAEHHPDVRACNAAVSFTAAGPGFENYSARCASGDVLAVRCEFGNCRVLK